MSKPGSEKAKRTLLCYSIVIVAILPAGFVAHYLAQTHGRNYKELYTGKPIAVVEVSRRPDWAKPIELPGLPNLHKVSDDLYRGAQPTVEGLQQLKKLGVKTIVSLRLFGFDRDKIRGIGLGYQHIPMTAWHPQDKESVRFLKIVADPNNTPIFVHCRRGADRTGLMCAVYRVAVQDWSKAEAVNEMTNGGFGFNPVWGNLIVYINELDIEDVKRRVVSTE